VGVCVCASVRLSVCVYACLQLCMRARVCVCDCVCILVCLFVFVRVSVCVCCVLCVVRVHVLVNVCFCVCARVCGRQSPETNIVRTCPLIMDCGPKKHGACHTHDRHLKGVRLNIPDIKHGVALTQPRLEFRLEARCIRCVAVVFEIPRDRFGGHLLAMHGCQNVAPKIDTTCVCICGMEFKLIKQSAYKERGTLS